MKDIIIDIQKFGTWKFQLAVAINSTSSIDVNEEHLMHSKSDNKKIYDLWLCKWYCLTFQATSSTYQSGLETSKRRSYFTFDSVQVLYYKFHGLLTK